MSTIRPYQDNETRRQYRNQTETQKKQLSETKEALVVNNLIKEPVNLTSMYDSLVIPETTDSFRYTTKSPADKKSEKSAKKSLFDAQLDFVFPLFAQRKKKQPDIFCRACLCARCGHKKPCGDGFSGDFADVFVFFNEKNGKRGHKTRCGFFRLFAA